MFCASTINAHMWLNSYTCSIYTEEMDQQMTFENHLGIEVYSKND